MRYETQILNTEKELAAITEEWRHCWHKQRSPHPAQHPDSIALKMNSSDDDRIMAVALYGGGRMEGVAPLRSRRQELRCELNYRPVIRFKRRFIDYFGDSLLAPQDEEAAETFLDGIAEACIASDAISFKHIPVGTLLWKLLAKSPRPRKLWWTYSSPAEKHYQIRLTGSFAEYLAKFTSKERLNLKRCLSKLENHCSGSGGLRLDRITRRDQVRGFLAQAETISNNSWQGKAGIGLTASHKMIEKDETLADHGWLRSYLLCSGKGPKAFVRGRQINGVYYCDQTGFDHAWRDYSPGKVLFYLIIQDLTSADKVETLDFRHGDAEYKRFFSTHSYESQCLFLVRKTMHASVAFFIHGAFEKATGAMRAGFKRFNLINKVRQWRHKAVVALSRKTGAKPVLEN